MLLRKLVDEWKSIPGTLQWSPPDPDDGYIRLYTPLKLGGILETDLVLSAGTYSHLPDRHVTFELAVKGHDGRRRVRLIRIDWRDIRGGHSNNRQKCAGSARRVGETHIHSFDLNFVVAEERMKNGKLPCAVDVSEDLQTFEELRGFIGRHFRINNIDIVPRPDWVYDLFNEAG